MFLERCVCADAPSVDEPAKTGGFGWQIKTNRMSIGKGVIPKSHDMSNWLDALFEHPYSSSKTMFIRPELMGIVMTIDHRDGMPCMTHFSTERGLQLYTKTGRVVNVVTDPFLPESNMAYILDVEDMARVICSDDGVDVCVIIHHEETCGIIEYDWTL